jgi:hypothetical protein
VLRPGESEPVRLSATSAGGLVAAIYEKTDRAGIYEMLLDATDTEDMLARREDDFAANVPPSKSDVRRLSFEAVQRLFPGAQIDYQRGGRQRVQVATGGERGEIWRSLAYALLAMIFLESILAQRFGR